MWFKAKEFGWGWYPASWQGWLITLAHLCITALSAWQAARSTNMDLVLAALLVIVISSLLFVYIAYRTGEKPGWHWGDNR